MPHASYVTTSNSDNDADLCKILQGYVIVYDVTNESSFQCMDRLKKLIEKNKEKREVEC